MDYSENWLPPCRLNGLAGTGETKTTYYNLKEENLMFEVKVVEKVSKTGNPYQCLVIVFPNGYEKTVFLENAEKYMLP